MRAILVIAIAFLFSCRAIAQINEFVGTFSVSGATGTDPNFEVIGSFNSTMGFTAAQVDTTMRIVVRYVNGTTHRRNIYSITSVTSYSGSNVTMNVTRLTGDSTTFFPNGTHAVMKRTADGYLYDVPNVSQELESYINNFNLNTITDKFGTISQTIADNDIVALNQVAAISGHGVTATKGDGSVLAAVIPFRTLATNGIMKANDYARIKGEYTSIAVDSQIVIIQLDSGYNYYIDVIGNNGEVDVPSSGTPASLPIKGDKLNIFLYNDTESNKTVRFDTLYRNIDNTAYGPVVIPPANSIGLTFWRSEGVAWYLGDTPVTIPTGPTIEDGSADGFTLAWSESENKWKNNGILRIDYNNNNVGIGVSPSLPTHTLNVNGTFAISDILTMKRVGDATVPNLIIGNNPWSLTGSNNLFVGDNQNSANKTNIEYNTVIGSNAASSLTTGDNNTLVGGFSGGQLTTGSDNVVLGYVAANSLSTGLGNTVIGNRSGTNLSTGNLNVIIGYNAGNSLAAGSSNVAIGETSMQFAENITNSIGIGKRSLDSATFPSTENIAIGTSAGRYYVQGGGATKIRNSIFIGRQTDAYGDSALYQVVIGDGAESIGDYSVVIGSASRTDSMGLFGKLKLMDYTHENHNTQTSPYVLVSDSIGTVQKIDIDTLVNLVVEASAGRPEIGADTCYAVPISGGNPGSTLYVCANGPGVTAAITNNELYINSTPTVKVRNADWTLVAADVTAAADAGGATNWVRVRFQKTKGNTGYDDIRIPVVQKTSFPSTGALGIGNAGSIDIDNNPSVSVVGVGGGSIVLRVSGLVPGGNGYHLKFGSVH